MAKAIRWIRVAEVLRGNNATIRWLASRDERMITESKQMCAEFQWYFFELCSSGTVVDFTSYVSDMPRFSKRNAKFCEMPITAEDIRDAMKGCTREKSLRRDGLPFELYLRCQTCSVV